MTPPLVRALTDALREVRELIEGYVDADYNGVSFVPNDAMRAQQAIDRALAIAEAHQ